MTTWFLVSDSGNARVFSVERPGDEWSFVDKFEHPESREPSRESRTTDHYGRGRQGTGWRGIQTAFEPHTPPADVEHRKFADELSDYLEGARAARKFDLLVLVAAPRFLGVLKDALSVQVLKRVSAAVDKDLTQLDPTEIRDRLAALTSVDRS